MTINITEPGRYVTRDGCGRRRTMADPATLPELIAKARREGKWLFCAYQALWFSPDQLARENANGRFRWGVVNWQLRDPQEHLAAARRAVDVAQAEMDRIEQEITQ